MFGNGFLKKKEYFMNEKKIKSAFISGKIVLIAGKVHTRMYTQEERASIKANTSTLSKEKEEELEKGFIAFIKKNSPDLHKKLLPELY